MGRIVQVASAQMGPISRSDTRKDAVRRLIAMMREGHHRPVRRDRGAETMGTATKVWHLCRCAKADRGAP